MSTGNERMQTERKNFAAAAILCAVTLALVLTSLFGSVESGGTVQMLRLYLFIGAAFLGMLAVYYGSCAAARHRGGPAAGPRQSRLPRLLGAAAVAVWIVLVLVWQLFPGNGLEIGGQSGMLLYSGGVLLLGSVLFPLLRMRNKALQGSVCVAYAFACSTAVLYTFMVNLLNYDQGIVRHYTAMTWPLYNVAFNTPYVVNTSSTYGHFAIFFWPVFKVFGHSPYVIAAVLTGASLLVEGLFLWILTRATHSTMLRFLGAAASASIWISPSLYTAVSPLRTLWPLALTAYMIRCIGKNNFCTGRALAGGYFLCGLAVIWNTDSGLVTLAAYTICVWMAGWRQEKPFSRRMLFLYGKTLAGCAAALAETIALINVYNLLCGGPPILRACFFPLLGSSFSEDLGIPMDWVSKAWILPVCTFVAAIAAGLLATSLLGRLLPRDDLFCLACCGMMGLGNCYYFFNRSVAGWMNVLPLLLLCLVFLADRALCRSETARTDTLYQALQRGAGICGFLYLCLFAVNAFSNAGTLVNNRIAAGQAASDGLLQNVAAKLEAAIPPNTYAFGFYTQEIYACLGWDTGYHYRDVEDIITDARLLKKGEAAPATEQTDMLKSFTQTSCEILNEVNAQDGILVYAMQTNALIDNRELLPENAFNVDGNRQHWFYYYTKNPPVPAACNFEAAGKQMLPMLQARIYGFLHDSDEYEYWLSPENTMVLNAATLKQTGLYAEFSKPEGHLETYGLDKAAVTLYVEDQPVGQTEMLKADDEEVRTYTITAAPEDLPDIPADGMYDITLTLTADVPLGGSENICHALYVGEPKG